MKRSVCILLIIIFSVLVMNLISAVDIKLSKDSYYPGETLQAEITGNFINPLANSNILLYKEGVPRSMPAISDTAKYDDIYYFYLYLPYQEGNFSLRVENARYIESGIEKTDTIITNFTIKKSNETALKFSPGFIKTNKDFSIKLTSLTSNLDITAELASTGESKNLSLIKDTEKSLQFSAAGEGKTILKIIYSTEKTSSWFSSSTTQKYYEIPVFLFKENEINDSEPIINSTINNTTNSTIEPKVNITNKTNDEIKSLHCTDFGEQCAETEECDEKPKSSLEGPCCPGNCVPEKEKSYAWTIGLSIILFLFLILIYFYLKGKSKLKPKSTEQILQEKSERFNKRMSGDDEEVSGRLSKN